MSTPISPGGPENLLVALYRLAHRQQENFTTDSLAHLLRHLVRHEPTTALGVLDWLTDSNMFSGLGHPALCVRTQAATDENGIPDIRVESDDLYVIVEVKLDAVLTLDQVEAYERELRRCRRAHRLVALTAARPPDPLHTSDGARSRRWNDLRLVVRTWGELGLELNKKKSEARSPVTAPWWGNSSSSSSTWASSPLGSALRSRLNCGCTENGQTPIRRLRRSRARAFVAWVDCARSRTQKGSTGCSHRWARYSRARAG
jgi:hypothetical protein